MAYTWNKAGFDALYRLNASRTPWGRPAGDPRIWVHYNRGPMIGHTRQLLRVYAAIRDHLNNPNLRDVVIIGGGFGWVAEALDALGYNTVNVETSDHVLAAKGTTEEQDYLDALAAAGLDETYRLYGPDGRLSLDPLDYWGARRVRAAKTVTEEDVRSAMGRQAIRNKLAKVDLIVTERVIPLGNSAAEHLSFVEDVERLRVNGTPVAHIVSAYNDGRTPDTGDFLLLTPKQWRDAFDNNGFADHLLVGLNGRIG